MCYNLTTNTTNRKKTKTKNKMQEETKLISSTSLQPIKVGNGKATKRRRLNAVLDKLASNLLPPEDKDEDREDREDKEEDKDEDRSIELEIQVQASALKSETSESEESDSEKRKPGSPSLSHSSNLSSPVLPSSTLSSPLQPSSSPSKPFFSPLRLKCEEQLKSPKKSLNFPAVPCSSSPSMGNKQDESSTPGSPMNLVLENYEAYIKSQILSKMYLQQYVTNNINQIKHTDSTTPQTNSDSLQSNPLDLSKRPTAGVTLNPSMLPGGGPINPQTKYQVSALLMAHSSENGRLVIGESSEKHETSDGSGPPFICTICGQIFSLLDRLTKHMASRHKSRTNVDPSNKAYYCEVCKRSFARSDMLTRHMRLHTGIKPYTCRVCGQVFSRSDHLSTHQRTHTGEKPYRCPSCPYSACRRDMITRHMRTHTTGSRGEGESSTPESLDPLFIKEESS